MPEGQTEQQTQQSGSGQQQRAEQQPQGERDVEKRVPISELVAERKARQELERKLAGLVEADEKRKQAELSDVERAKSESEKLQKRVAELESRERKMAALRAAKQKLGSGYTLDGVEAKLEAQIEKLAFNAETVDADVAELVELAKRPRGDKSPLGAKTRDDNSVKDPKQMTPKELAALHKEDPEEYRRVMDERTRSFSFPTKPPVMSQMLQPPMRIDGQQQHGESQKLKGKN